MTYVIDSVKALTVGTAAQTVEVGYRPFILKNNTAENILYFKERAADNKACTAANGFPVAAGVMTDTVLCAKTLSLIASAASTDVRILFLREA